MQLHIRMTLGSRSSSESERSLSMALESPPLTQRQSRGPTVIANMNYLEQADSGELSTIGMTNPRSMTDKQYGIGRGCLPSIDEVHPKGRFPASIQEGFAQAFGSNGSFVGSFVRRKSPQSLNPAGHPGYRGPVKDRIIKHGLSETHLRARVEPIPDETNPNQVVGNGSLETTSFWLTPASASGSSSPRQFATRPLPVPASLNSHRESVTIDGRLRRVRFLSADHTPLKDADLVLKKLLTNKNNIPDPKKNLAAETNTKMKPSDVRNFRLRSVAVQGVRRTSADDAQVTKQKVEGIEDQKESPDVWLERARKLRASKDKNNNAVSKEDSIGKRSETLKIHNDDTNSENDKTLEKTQTTSTHINYCDKKKTEWVIKWLHEVNRQTHFDIIE